MTVTVCHLRFSERSLNVQKNTGGKRSASQRKTFDLKSRYFFKLQNVLLTIGHIFEKRAVQLRNVSNDRICFPHSTVARRDSRRHFENSATPASHLTCTFRYISGRSAVHYPPPAFPWVRVLTDTHPLPCKGSSPVRCGLRLSRFVISARRNDGSKERSRCYVI